MSDSESTSSAPGTPTLEQPLTRLPFPPLKKSHIIHCSYHYWHPRYRTITPKARLVPLTPPFLEYLRSDGIVLPSESPAPLSDDDSGIFSSTDDTNPNFSDDEDEDVSTAWLSVHEQIKSTIAELGGKVVPKLNWSAPKDATWISATNSMECRTANDIYLLLKSSDFVTHDLEHVFDDCEEDESPPDNDEKSTSTEDVREKDDAQVRQDAETVPYVLALRKWVQLNPSLEFRCFVRNRKLLGICQRDLNHFDFLFALRPHLKAKIEAFFHDKIKDSFPDENFTFDVYVPPPHDRVWLVDFNPWAVRTDPLLFSWLEILTMEDPVEEKVVRIPIQVGASQAGVDGSSGGVLDGERRVSLDDGGSEDDDEEEDSEDDVEDLDLGPEFRLVKRDDPEAYMFNSTRYSAHKLPKDVVDASQSGAGGLREFAENWRDVLAKRQQEDRDVDSEDD